MSGPGWRTHGIDEDIFVAKSYCTVSKTVIAHFYSKPKPHEQPIYSLYTKSEGNEDFKKIAPSSDLSSYQNFFLAQNQPIIFVNEWEILKWTKNGETTYLGYDIVALKQIDVTNHEVKTIIDKYDYGPNKNLTDRRLWTMDFLGYDIQNNMLYTTVALEKQIIKVSGQVDYKLEYHLGSIDLKTRKIDLIRKFSQSPFF